MSNLMEYCVSNRVSRIKINMPAKRLLFLPFIRFEQSMGVKELPGHAKYHVLFVHDRHVSPRVNLHG